MLKQCARVRVGFVVASNLNSVQIEWIGTLIPSVSNRAQPETICCRNSWFVLHVYYFGTIFIFFRHKVRCGSTARCIHYTINTKRKREKKNKRNYSVAGEWAACWVVLLLSHRHLHEPLSLDMCALFHASMCNCYFSICNSISMWIRTRKKIQIIGLKTCEIQSAKRLRSRINFSNVEMKWNEMKKNTMNENIIKHEQFMWKGCVCQDSTI